MTISVFYKLRKTQAWMLAKFTVEITINTFGTFNITKSNTFTKLLVKSLFMVRFSKLKLLQKAGKLLDTSELGSSLYVSAYISQNRLSQVVCTVNPWYFQGRSGECLWRFYYCGLTSRHTLIIGLALRLTNYLYVTILHRLQEMSLSVVQSKVVGR